MVLIQSSTPATVTSIFNATIFFFPKVTISAFTQTENMNDSMNNVGVSTIQTIKNMNQESKQTLKEMGQSANPTGETIQQNASDFGANVSNYNLVCSRVKVVNNILNENNTINSFFSVPSYLFPFLDWNSSDSD